MSSHACIRRYLMHTTIIHPRHSACDKRTPGFRALHRTDRYGPTLPLPPNALLETQHRATSGSLHKKSLLLTSTTTQGNARLYRVHVAKKQPAAREDTAHPRDASQVRMVQIKWYNVWVSDKIRRVQAYTSKNPPPPSHIIIHTDPFTASVALIVCMRVSNLPFPPLCRSANQTHSVTFLNTYTSHNSKHQAKARSRRHDTQQKMAHTRHTPLSDSTCEHCMQSRSLTPHRGNE